MRRASGRVGGAILVILTGTTPACGDVNAALEQLLQARQVSADLMVQFTKAADAANRAVMADTDEASVAAAREAVLAKQAVAHDIDALRPLLAGLGYAEETRLLEDFVSRFAAYDTLDRSILDLAVENTNLKAQRLSFGPAQDAADRFHDALDGLIASAAPSDAWHVRALAAVPSTARPGIATATAALDRFLEVHAQILALSHRNTNVRSLALSLSQKPALIAACEDRLHALTDALAKRGYKVARWK